MLLLQVTQSHGGAYIREQHQTQIVRTDIWTSVTDNGAYVGTCSLCISSLLVFSCSALSSAGHSTSCQPNSTDIVWHVKNALSFPLERTEDRNERHHCLNTCWSGPVNQEDMMVRDGWRRRVLIWSCLSVLLQSDLFEEFKTTQLADIFLLCWLLDEDGRSLHINQHMNREREWFALCEWWRRPTQNWMGGGWDGFVVRSGMSPRSNFQTLIEGFFSIIAALLCRYSVL